MALPNDYKLTVDLNGDNGEVIHATQGDSKSRRLIIKVTANGEEVDISEYTVQLKCSVNGTADDISACEIENNRVIAELTAAMLSRAGKHELELSLIDSAGSVISVPFLEIFVAEATGEEIVTSTPEFSALSKLTARLEAVLNDPEVGDSEVKLARGGYSLLGDRISAIESAGINALRFKGAKNCIKHSSGFTAESVGTDSFYASGLTLSAEDGCAVAEGTAGKSGSVFALFDEPITLARDSSRQVLAVMRIKAVGSDLRVYPLAGRYLGYYNYLCDSNIIESNITEHIGTNSYIQPLKKDEWVTIWALLGDTGKSFKLGGDETQLNGLGVYIPIQTDGSAPKLMIQSVCAYVSDNEERDLLGEIRESINANSGRLTIAEGKIDNIVREIEDLQTNADNNNKAVASLSDTVKNSSDSVAEVKSVVEDMQRNISELSMGGYNNKKNIEELQATVTENGESLAEAESEISDIQSGIGTIRENIESHTNSITDFSKRITELESKASAALEDISDIKAHIGLGDEVLGLQVDFENRRFARLAGAVNLTAGDDFDKFDMFGGRKRCNVADDGTITAYYGDENYTEDGSNGQVMVYQPAFYYKVVPVIYEKNKESGIGYHLRKANYYVTARPHAGFKLHPAFIDGDGNEVDYILYSAYEGSIFDSSVGDYLRNDEQIADFNTDMLASISGVKPASGKSQNLTRANSEKLASNRGAGWHIDTIKSVSANQLLMMIEYAAMNIQSEIGQGIVTITDKSGYNCSSITGSTFSLGSKSGQATETVNEIAGVKATYNTPGKVAISYRGVENPWGNIWKFAEGINIWGDGTMGGGQPYVTSDFSFSENKHTDNYKASGSALPNANGYISAVSYASEEFDWLFMPSEIGNTSSLSIGDFCYASTNLNGYKIALLGNKWNSGSYAGSCSYHFKDGISVHGNYIGCRLLYVPAARV